MKQSVRKSFKKAPAKLQVPFIEPMLASAMMLERYIDACIKKISDYGISQFKILGSIERATACKNIESINQSELARFWGVSEAAISRQVSHLEKDKLLVRYHDPRERRCVILKLSAKGRTFVAHVAHHLEKEFVRLFKPLSASKKDQLGKDMHRVAEILDKYINT
jgi:DNA-binding MarR family transcriptional regulator